MRRKAIGGRTLAERKRSETARRFRIVGLTVLVAAAAGAVVAWIIRDQLARHRRDLFSPNSFERLAALTSIARAPATVDNITLLKDFIVWEPRRLIRRRAEAVLRHMEQEARVRESLSVQRG